MHKKILLPALLLIAQVVINSSCLYKMVASKAGLFEKEAKLLYYNNGSKKMVGIPMHHVGEPAFYQDVTRKIDSLQKDGYIIFFEGIAFDPTTDSLQKDEMSRKMRHVIGLVPSRQYLGPEGVLMGKQFSFLKNMINQPKAYQMGVDSTTAVKADVTINELIAATEKKFGTIALEPCDLSTPLADTYKCTKITDKALREYLLLGYRNEVLANFIQQHPAKKIVVLYGAKHFDTLLDYLQQKDTTWVQTP